MSCLHWPEGLAGSHLDAVARAALWQAGLDYDHGTGHGVGAFLSVHEGPAGLSRRSVAPLLPGMILSVEPGVYREGAWGSGWKTWSWSRRPRCPRAASGQCSASRR